MLDIKLDNLSEFGALNQLPPVEEKEIAMTSNFNLMDISNITYASQ